MTMRGVTKSKTEFTGCRIIVSGASNGIGEASAKAFKSRGSEVLALDSAEPRIDVDQWIQVNLADPHAIQALSLSGTFDALVNAAGLPPRPGNEFPVLAVNYFGLTALCEKVLPLMPPGGSIVNVSSKAGARWRENIAQVRRLVQLCGPTQLPAFLRSEELDPVRAYDLSKEAVIYWTKKNTARLRDLGLRANAVSPAAVETRILADFEAAFGERARRGTQLMGRPGKPDEIASIIAFLAGPQSEWIKGCNIETDGGLTAQLDIEAVGG